MYKTSTLTSHIVFHFAELCTFDFTFICWLL